MTGDKVHDRSLTQVPRRTLRIHQQEKRNSTEESDAMDIDIEPQLQVVRTNLQSAKLKEVVSEEQDVLMLEHNLSVGEALRVRFYYMNTTLELMAELLYFNAKSLSNV